MKIMAVFICVWSAIEVALWYNATYRNACCMALHIVPRSLLSLCIVPLSGCVMCHATGFVHLKILVTCTLLIDAENESYYVESYWPQPRFYAYSEKVKVCTR